MSFNKLSIIKFMLKDLLINTASRVNTKLFYRKQISKFDTNNISFKLKVKAKDSKQAEQHKDYLLKIIDSKLKKMSFKFHTLPEYNEDGLWKQNLTIRLLKNQSVCSDWNMNDNGITFEVSIKLTFKDTIIDTFNKKVEQKETIEEYNLESFLKYSNTFDNLYFLSFIDIVKLNSLINNIKKYNHYGNK